jgi:two-component system OmpR family response regulator
MRITEVAQNSPQSIFYVEDDPVIRANFTELFEADGFQVLSFSSFDAASENIETQETDIAVFDIELGSEPQGGLELCRRFRERFPDRPIILLTSHDQDSLQAKGWQLGADDYVPKNTSLMLIMVRIRALLSRYQNMKALYGGRHNVSPVPSLEIDAQNYAIYWKGCRLDLSLTQYWIVHSIIEASGDVVGHEKLQSAANIVVEPNTIVAHIKNIRAQFKRFDSNFNHIKTERGHGYRWDLSV